MKYLGQNIDFSAPRAAEALTPPTSVSWRVFKNPVTIAIGGVAAVLLELAEPRVRAGVWGYSSFRDKPLRRMRRTGLAAMVTVYGPRETAEAMIASVRKMHAHVKGVTPNGLPYSAEDPALLNWMQATAAFGFMEAYSTYAQALSVEEKNRFYEEGRMAAQLYGAVAAPISLADQQIYFSKMAPLLEATSVIPEFISTLHKALPAPGPMKKLMVRAAVDILPDDIGVQIGVEMQSLKPDEQKTVRRFARLADRLPLPLSPPVLACKRMGLPGNFLFQK